MFVKLWNVEMNLHNIVQETLEFSLWSVRILQASLNQVTDCNIYFPGSLLSKRDDQGV